MITRPELSVQIFAPYPPSLNTLYPTVGNRRILSKAATRYKNDLGWQFRRRYAGFQIVKDQDLFCIIELIPKDNRRRDIDNVAKIILDSFTGLIYEDDSQIKKLMIIKSLPDETPGAIIHFGQIDNFEEYAKNPSKASRFDF
jgi:Holliday junction resolvase RusA-like endonuclease